MSAEPADRCAVDYLAENKTNGRRGAHARVAHRATGEQLVGDATVIDLPCHRDDVTQISRRISAPTRRHASRPRRDHLLARVKLSKTSSVGLICCAADERGGSTTRRGSGGRGGERRRGYKGTDEKWNNRRLITGGRADSASAGDDAISIRTISVDRNNKGSESERAGDWDDDEMSGVAAAAAAAATGRGAAAILSSGVGASLARV